MQAQVEQLPENRVRLRVQVPSHDVHHAVEHAASDLAQSAKIRGFRKGKVPRQVLGQRGLDAVRATVAELVPVEGRPVGAEDTVIVDLVSPGGETRRDYVVELGRGAVVDEVEEGVVGLSAGETQTIEFELADDTKQAVEVTVKEIKERGLPVLDDELARAASG